MMLTIVFVVVTYWLLAVKNGFMLRWYDEMSLFEPTMVFFRPFLYYPGGLLRWAGCWLTQLLYHPWLGSTTLIVLWLLLGWLIRKVFRLSGNIAPVALLVPLALLVSVVQLDEAWLSLKSPGYVFSNTLGYIFTAVTLLLYRSAYRRPVISAAVSILSAFCYFLAGFYALLAAALCSILCVLTSIREKRYFRIDTAVITIILIIIIPQLYYTYFQGNTVDNDYLYLKGLPELMIERFDIYLWIPFITASATMLVLTLVSLSARLKDNTYVGWLGIATVCLAFAWGVRASEKSEQLRATVLMLQRLDRNDWYGMTAVMSRIKQPPSYTMRILNNLALVHLGQQGESMADYSPARGDGRHSEKFTMTAFVQVPLYYNIGRFNQSYRWAMEHTVQYGKRVFFLKYMVKDALLRGEIKLAKRYNDILLATMFHRKWAKDMNRYIEDPSLIDSNENFQWIFKLGEGEEQEANADTTADIH